MSKSTSTPSANPSDPLNLTPLFAGGAEAWLPLLKPVIEARPRAATFIGPQRGRAVVPVRELTFQALKPNLPHKWKVVVFGQNPYPRVESATGIAMFDNTFTDWKDGRFGRVASIRCIIKAAAMWKHGIPKTTPIADIRKLLADHHTVPPPEWFQAMLTQGVLLLNAALTASSDEAMATEEHTSFWRPVVEVVVEEILRSKQLASDADRGVVFAWWGAHARNLKGLVQRLQKKYPAVRVKHVDHCNPAAQGDLFCNKDHFKTVNQALEEVGNTGIDWLPSTGWNAAPEHGEGTADRMGQFITDTMELHKMYLERLEDVKDEVLAELPPITGVLDTPLMPFADAIAPVGKLITGLNPYVKRSIEFARSKVKTSVAGGLTVDEVAAVYLYTCESALYRRLNAALRELSRTEVKAYFAYLRLFLSALAKLPVRTEKVWRGVGVSLKAQYPKDGTVTWWGVSSCTSKVSVARAFLGGGGARTLFEVTPARATGIRSFSAYTGEEEFLLAPGTQLKVAGVTAPRGGLCTVRLEEVPETCLVA